MRAIEFLTELKQTKQLNLAELSTADVDLGFEVEFLVPKEGDNVGAYWAQQAEDKLGIKIEYGGNYEVGQPLGHWRMTYDDSIKGDGHGLEIISPPELLEKGVADLKKVLEWIRTEEKLSTNGTTGLHLNLSFGDRRTKNIDPLKLMLFLGEKYLSELFPRELEIDKSNDPFGNFKGHVRQILPELARHLHNSMKFAWYDKDQEKMSLTTEYVSKWIEEAKKAITPDKDPYSGSGGLGGTDHEVRHSKSFTVALVKLIRKGYIEFRVTGGDKYEERLDEILQTLGRYIRVMDVASDPNAYRQEYLKKAAKLIAYSQKFQKNPNDEDQQLEHEDRDEDLRKAFEEVFAKHNRVQEYQVRSFIRQLQDGNIEGAMYRLDDIYTNNKEHYPDFFNDPKVIRLLNIISKRYGLTRNEIANYYEKFGGEDGMGYDDEFEDWTAGDRSEDWEYRVEKKQKHDYKPLIQWLRL